MPRGRTITKVIEVEECSAEQASAEFFRHNQIKGLSAETQKGYRGYVNNFIKWYGAENPVSEITTRTVDDYLYSKTEQGENKDVSLATNMTHIRRFINFCVSRGYMEKIIVTIPKYEEELKDPYTDEEMKLLLARPTTKNWVEWRCWAMTNYFFSTGQRLSTVLNIKVEHIDFENSTVKLLWNKDKRPKYMPLSSALVKVLREYIELSGLVEQDYLFPEYEGGQLKRRSAQDAMTDYNHARGVERTGIHLFRHTFAKNYIVNGGNPVKLQKLLNHKTIEQTMKYVNLYGSDISKDLDLFNPLDSFKRHYYTPTKRVEIIGA